MIVEISTAVMNFLQGLLKLGADATQIGIQAGNPISIAMSLSTTVGGDIQSWLASLLNLPIGKLGLC